ncbi:unnamed protein product [Durusdinium trenchii]|uniref:Uncharacterized protein n=1 Tax=Durusdinium trenchii TaxID=1381693 RepID=A0ABP0QB33_9DINO
MSSNKSCKTRSSSKRGGSSSMELLLGQLHWPCFASGRSVEVFELLMEVQADPFQPDAEGRTPFLECARVGNCSFMALLLKGSRGTVLLDMDRECKTALHYAAEAGKKEAIQLLLKAGATVEALDLQGRSAASYANEAGHDEVVAMIAEAMSDELLEEMFMDEADGAAPSNPGTTMPGHAAPNAPNSDEELPGLSDDPGLEIPEEEHLQGRLHQGASRHLSPEASYGPGHRLQSL